MNSLTCASKLCKQVDKQLASHLLALGYTPDAEEIESIRAKIDKLAMDQLRVHMKKAVEIQAMFKEILPTRDAQERATQTYFITVRPDSERTTLAEFIKITEKFSKRVMFKYGSYSYEQKGVTRETLGQGYHMHMIVKTTAGAKGEVLRATQSSFKKIAKDEYCDVKLCKNPKSHTQKYLVDYESNDNHKIVTKEWDSIWRSQNDLESLYKIHNDNSGEPDASPAGQT